MSILSSIKHYLWEVVTKRMHLDYTLRSGIKVVVRNYTDWCTYNDLLVNGEYRDAIDDAIAEWSPKAGLERLCVLDLGANTGYFAIQMADVFLTRCPVGEMALRPIEASAKVAMELQRRLVIPGNRVDAQIISGLVGKQEGRAQLNFGAADTVNFVGEAGDGNTWGAARGAATVSYVNLDTLTAAMPVVHLIKCDIEGSEFTFIDNYPGLLAKTRRIAIEFHAPFGDIGKAVERLRGMGFNKVVTLRDSAATPTIYFARP